MWYLWFFWCKLTHALISKLFVFDCNFCYNMSFVKCNVLSSLSIELTLWKHFRSYKPKVNKNFWKLKVKQRKFVYCVISLQCIFIENYTLFDTQDFNFLSLTFLTNVDFFIKTKICPVLITQYLQHVYTLKKMQKLCILLSLYIQYLFKFIIMQFFKLYTKLRLWSLYLSIQCNLTFNNNKLFRIFNHWFKIF